MPNLSDLTEEQQGQHRAVIKVALHNLATITDSLQTLNEVIYDEALDSLDAAKETLEHKQTILEKLRSK